VLEVREREVDHPNSLGYATTSRIFNFSPIQDVQSLHHQIYQKYRQLKWLQGLTVASAKLAR
jgi:hypothetical protein